MTPSLERWTTKAKEAPSPHEVRIAPLDTIPVFLVQPSMPVQNLPVFPGYYNDSRLSIISHQEESRTQQPS